MHTIIQCPSKNKCTNQVINPQPNPIRSRQCPKFNMCNAPVCPLDATSIKIKHISGDKCCVYLLETAKIDAKVNFIGAGLSNIYEAIEVVKKDILTSSATIRRAFTRAANTPSRLQPKFIQDNKSCV